MQKTLISENLTRWVEHSIAVAAGIAIVMEEGRKVDTDTSREGRYGYCCSNDTSYYKLRLFAACLLIARLRPAAACSLQPVIYSCCQLYTHVQRVSE